MILADFVSGDDGENMRGFLYAVSRPYELSSTISGRGHSSGSYLKDTGYCMAGVP
jgi:hypothetical protein